MAMWNRFFGKKDTQPRGMEERALTPNIVKEFANVTSQGEQMLGITDPQTAPEAIVASIDSYIDKWQEQMLKGMPQPVPSGKDVLDVALGLGAAWGNQFVRQFGWEWTSVIQDKKTKYVVACPKRAMLIAPAYFVGNCLRNPNIDCTIMLAFNMLKAKMPDYPDHGYLDVMSVVRRIVPKR